MDEEVEEVSFEIIPAFTGFGNHPIYKDKPFRVIAPSHYTFQQVINKLRYSDKSIAVGDRVKGVSLESKDSISKPKKGKIKEVRILYSSDTFAVKNISTEFEIKSKLSKRSIRTRLGKNNHFFSPQKRLNQIGIVDGDTVHLILPGNPVTPPRTKPGKGIHPKKR